MRRHGWISEMSRQVKKARHKKERVQRRAKLIRGGRNQESGYLWEVWSEGGTELWDVPTAWWGKWSLCGKAVRCALRCVDLATVFEFQWTGIKLRWERLGMNMHLGGEVLAWSPGHLQSSWINPVTADTLHLRSCTASFPPTQALEGKHADPGSPK